MYLFDTWIPGSIVFWGALVLIVLISSYFRYRTRASHHRMMEKLAEKGQSVTPAPTDRMEDLRQPKDQI
jgi:hypothetical protein